MPDERSGPSRRQVLVLAGTGVAAISLGSAGVIGRWGAGDGADDRAGTTPRGDAGGSALTEPDELRSAGGVLEARLRAVAGPVTLAGRTVHALSYNGSVPGPTLRLRPGDRVRVDVENALGAATNLHVHGLHVSPRGNGDNPLVRIEDGETFRYEYDVPPDHPTGTFWYHPHLHGLVADQLFGGLAGTIVIESDEDPELPAARERVLVVSDVSLDGDRVAAAGPMDVMAGREGELVLVNGQLRPSARVEPGSWEHWRVVNACTSRFLRLRLDGGELVQIGADAGHLAEPVEVDDVLLAPGNRVQLLARLGTAQARLTTLPVDRGDMGMGMGPGMGPGRGEQDATVLLELTGGATASDPPALPDRLVDLPDLREAAVDGRRTLTFAMGMGMGTGMGRGMAFTIDGREFDAQRVDTPVTVGTVEEWTIANVSPMDHPFHLHVWPVQVVARDGEPVQGPPQWLDVVNVPAGRTVTLRVRFADFPGLTVYHCHILDHEDLGMMGTLLAEAEPS
ncbi:multicopper oxidase family protein [Kineosporiaceae bacterium SCSIO 59966]|nr:multicopper oxidase family protein [Kineosporiaceae bacterium SCSIO 59966]